MIRILLPILTFCLFSGCLSDSIQMPDLFHPGMISEQQRRLRQFDPFPQEGMGPKIEGARPHGAVPRPPVEYVGDYHERQGYYFYKK